MKAKHKFVGYVINGKPVTVEEAKKAGIIKKDPEEKEKPKTTKNNTDNSL